MVRSLLNGAFANTSFCVFDPQGKERLSRTGRGPAMGLSTARRRGGQTDSDTSVIKRMNEIASDFTPTGKAEDIALQDFDTFRQALNVASADQRLLVFVNADKQERGPIESKLKQVFADSDVVGKFHLNFFNEESDKNWSTEIRGSEKEKPGIVIIRSGTYGIDGMVMDQLALDSSADDIKSAMLDANKKFASLEERKTYSKHVTAGRRQRIYFENEIPYGEDRDGDGKIDNQRRGRNR